MDLAHRILVTSSNEVESTSISFLGTLFSICGCCCSLPKGNGLYRLLHNKTLLYIIYLLWKANNRCCIQHQQVWETFFWNERLWGSSPQCKFINQRRKLYNKKYLQRGREIKRRQNKKVQHYVMDSSHWIILSLLSSLNLTRCRLTWSLNFLTQSRREKGPL